MSVKYVAWEQDEINKIKKEISNEVEVHGDHLDIDLKYMLISIIKVGYLYTIASYDTESCVLDVWSFDNMFELLSELRYLKGEINEKIL